MENDIIKFLLGEGSFDGVWFGEKHPAYTGMFWWRNYLRQYVAQNQPNSSNTNVGGPSSAVSGEGGQLPAEGQEEANMCVGRAVCPKCGKNFYSVTKLWNHIDRCSA